MADQTEVERLLVKAFPMCDDPGCRIAAHARGRSEQTAKRENLRPLLEMAHAAGYEAGARAKWISVSEKLPEDGQVVLAWFVDDNRTIGGELREDAQVWEYSEGHPCFPRKAGKRQGVTHWQAFEAVRSLPLTEGK